MDGKNFYVLAYAAEFTGLDINPLVSIKVVPVQRIGTVKRLR